MGIYMGPTWATHKGLMRDLQQGSMLDPHGQSHVGTIWVQYGKNQPTFIFQKKQFLHIFTQMIISPQSQPIWWTGKVPTDRGLCTCASYCLKDIGVFFNSWKCWHHAYLYIPLNFKNNRDIRVKIKIWPWIDVHVGKIVKINLIDTFIL